MNSPALLLLGRLGVGLLLLLALWLAAGHQGDFQWPDVPAPLWLAASAGLLLSHGLRGARIQAELSGLAQVRFLDCLRVGLLHSAAVNLLPLRGGELAYPWLAHQRLGISRSDAVASLLRMRLQDTVVLAMLAALLMPRWPLPFRLASVFLGAFMVVVVLNQLKRLAPRSANTRWRRLWRALCTAPKGGAGWALSVGSWCLKLAAVALLLSQSTGLPLLLAAVGAWGGEAGALSPLQGPAGLGSYEAGVWLTLSWAGPAQPMGAVVTGALAAHLCIFSTTVLAAAVAWLTWRRDAVSPVQTAVEPHA